MPNQVHNETKTERARVLKALDDKIRRSFGESQIGVRQMVIVEEVNGRVGRGWTGNYLKAEFPIGEYKKNNLIELKPISYNNRILFCQINLSI